MNAELGDHPLSGMLGAEAMKAAATIEQHLAKHDYFAGDAFTAADCLMGFQIQNGAERFGLEGLPATNAWLERVQARPAYQRMLDVGI